MNEIDLIPAWYLRQRRQRRDRVIRYAYLAVVVVAMAGLALVRRGQTAAAADALAAMRPGSPGATATEGALAEFQVRLGEVERKRRLVADAGGGVRSHALLAELSSLMPAATVITTLHVVEKSRPSATGAVAVPPNSERSPASATEEDGRIGLEGLAASDSELGRFMAGLSGSRVFADVRLGYSRRVQVEGREARAFELGCRVPRFE